MEEPVNWKLGVQCPNGKVTTVLELTITIGGKPLLELRVIGAKPSRILSQVDGNVAFGSSIVTCKAAAGRCEQQGQDRRRSHLGFLYDFNEKFSRLERLKR